MSSNNQCIALTLKNTRCTKKAKENSLYCGIHQNKEIKEEIQSNLIPNIKSESNLIPDLENIVGQYTEEKDYEKLKTGKEELETGDDQPDHVEPL